MCAHFPDSIFVESMKVKGGRDRGQVESTHFFQAFTEHLQHAGRCSTCSMYTQESLTAVLKGYHPLYG